jgi:hypothetical protein
VTLTAMPLCVLANLDPRISPICWCPNIIQLRVSIMSATKEKTRLNQIRITLS